jgi:hypothetical protein
MLRYGKECLTWKDVVFHLPLFRGKSELDAIS